MGGDAKVLVTDDDPQILELTATVLRKAGFDVLEASTGGGCLKLVQSHRPDVVLLDVVLPDLSGVDVCKRIKADKRLEGIFVILVSGVQVSSEYQAEGLDVGADGYIVKPISNKELVARVQSMVRIKRAENALREREREQERLISELREALAEIKTLKGFIPICASCKKIRDDQGFWNRLETYISEHTDAVLSHGICPECAEKYKNEIKELAKKRQ
ncbi:MAG TPA: response regulator [Syntrophorhabdales bacterium]|nr:response regulator [Syntrophorhabdales bacterium]